MRFIRCSLSHAARKLEVYASTRVIEHDLATFQASVVTCSIAPREYIMVVSEEQSICLLPALSSSCCSNLEGMRRGPCFSVMVVVLVGSSKLQWTGTVEMA